MREFVADILWLLVILFFVAVMIIPDWRARNDPTYKPPGGEDDEIDH
jgi:hypothetical protein